MIDGGWFYVWAAYAVTGGSLLVLAAAVLARLRYWAARARELERS